MAFAVTAATPTEPTDLAINFVAFPGTTGGFVWSKTVITNPQVINGAMVLSKALFRFIRFPSGLIPLAGMIANSRLPPFAYITAFPTSATSGTKTSKAEDTKNISRIISAASSPGAREPSHLLLCGQMVSVQNIGC
jgi:hypothetical protein